MIEQTLNETAVDESPIESVKDTSEILEKLQNIDVSDVKTYILKKPITVGGKTYCQFKVDFDSIKSSQLRTISRRPGLISQDAPFYELSKTYQELVVSLATNTPVQVISELYSADWTALTVMAQVFLLGSASEALSQ